MDVRTLGDLDEEEKAALVDRDAGIDAVRTDVESIVTQVRDGGDDTLRRFCREFDGVDVETFDATDRAAAAYEELDDDLRAAIDTAAANIRDFHERQVPTDWRTDLEGRQVGRRFTPIERVGVYTPGGTAAYPSSALMGVIPAVVAGVDQVAVATPPAEEQNPVTLAAIHAAGADEVYTVGGAQAIAALAYGTDAIPPVEKVVGPGNRWVTAAKAVVQGDVAIDFLAGPSEILVIADQTADSDLVAADVVAQAEHDPKAAVVAVSDDRATAEAVAESIDDQAAEHPRADTIHAALEHDASGVFFARSMTEAAAFADEYAPEHLSIQSANDELILREIHNAGSVFLGPETPVAAGDYASGTNHVLPTNGRARVTGGLSVDTFLRSTTVQRLSHAALADLRETITTLAEAEGLDAHAASVERRFDPD